MSHAVPPLVLLTASGAQQVTASASAVRAAAGQQGWVGLLWPGEQDGAGILPAALRMVAALPQTTAGIALRRVEDAPTGLRERDVVRLLRPERLRHLGEDADASPSIDGQVVGIGGGVITFDRS
ncbi:MAG: hypothetical protein GXP62_02940, partial [Oligoflexia bacterium]|nr:hypothetical protein [Oligoflexia bacterium]